MQNLSIKISRFTPGADDRPELREYDVLLNDGAMVLDALIYVKDNLDQTLRFRYCCRAGQCGSCAIKMNGEPVLACMTAAVDGMVIEPLDFPVIKDLVTDIEPVLKDIPGVVPCESCEVPTKKQIDAIKPLRDCIECLCCVSACPAMKVVDFKGPTVMRQEMRIELDPRDVRNLVPGAVNEGLFTCTSCQKCVEVCPKDIRIPHKAIEKLRELANRQGFTLPRHQEVAELVKATGRSVDVQKETLFSQVPDVIEPDGEVRAEVGFFVGCMYNMRVVQNGLDALEVLKRNGVRVIIPKEQVCCGSPLIRTGQTSFLDDLKRKNIECFEKRGIKRVMTMCAGCGSTLKNDYNTPYEVVDINELLTEIGIEPPEKLDVKVTYHDPCHLMRGQGVESEPREILRMITDDFVEMPSICCGAGGGVRSGLPDEAAALGKLRDTEIQKTGCDIVVTSCPFCEFHIQDSTKKPVKNINSLLLEGYRKKDALKSEDGK
jgi:fumarate reductase (CoM/CoB) subunit B